jgi:hypothetical protein
MINMDRNPAEKGAGQESTPEDRFNALSLAEQEKLKNSWGKVEEMVGPEAEIPEGVEISKIEHQDNKTTRKLAKELTKFLAEYFSEKETTDAETIEQGISQNLFQNYVARDKEGKIVSYLQSQAIESQSLENNPELSQMIWYIVTRKGYQGKSPVKNLLNRSLNDLLEKSKSEAKPIKGLIGETEDRVEKYMNRLGLDRIYYKDANGKTSRVPYECPPEDESTKGVSEHFMIKLLDGRKNMPKQEFLNLVDGVYAQYSRPEYFEDDERGRQCYLKIIAKIREKLVKSLEGVDGDLFFMSERERRTGQPQGQEAEV